MSAFFLLVGVLCVVATITERNDAMRAFGFVTAGALAFLFALAAW